MQFIPVVERQAAQPGADGLVLIQPSIDAGDGAAQVTEWSVEPLAYGQFLARIFDEWVKADVGRFYVQQFDVALESWLGMEASLCVFREDLRLGTGDRTFGRSVTPATILSIPEHKLGNIMEQDLAHMAGSAQQKKFGLDKRDSLPRMCRECDVRFACNGECPKHRLLQTPMEKPA